MTALAWPWLSLCCPFRVLAQAERGPTGRWMPARVTVSRRPHPRCFAAITSPPATRSAEPIVVVGGSATIDGHAEDDVVVIGGTLRVGPTGVVLGDVVTVGGESDDRPGRVIDGRVETTTVTGPDIDIGWEPWHLTRGSGPRRRSRPRSLRLG